MIQIKSRFPGLMNNPDVIYFDNASTTQKPDTVLESVQNYYKDYCANAGRGAYTWANNVSREIEKVRKKVALFINASYTDEIVFTSGATEALNLVAYSYGLNNLKDGDEVLLSSSDHKSLVLPWLNLQNVLKNFNINIKIIYIKPDPSGDYVLEDIRSKLSKRTKILSLTHVHNVYGVDMDIENIRNLAGPDILLLVDTSQSVGHKKVDVKAMGADFICFSGHKMFSETGVGVFWANKRIHTYLRPHKIGGGYEGKINWNSYEIEKTTMPGFLECGTLNIGGIISLGSAIDFINEVGLDYIQNHLIELSAYLINKLNESTLDIEYLRGSTFCSKCSISYGIVSFKIRGIRSDDVGFILNENKILVRTGRHCLANDEVEDDSIRVSFHIYNTFKEIDTFMKVLIQNL
jgi:cysteine desulfurase/selenocysteine lyase